MKLNFERQGAVDSVKNTGYCCIGPEFIFPAPTWQLTAHPLFQFQMMPSLASVGAGKPKLEGVTCEAFTAEIAVKLVLLGFIVQWNQGTF